ncbi:MAG: hypothetical protein QOH05_945 [Acetobacteraceae bacterium]|nr:hypothetical protein [Acetobacteraceae bacterium]
MLTFMQQPEADLLVQAATAALANGQVAQATTLLDDAVRIDPRHPMALTKQAELALYRKDHARALALSDAALAIEPNFAPAWHKRSSACWLAGRQKEALRAARRAVDIQPPNPEFRLRLAQFTAWCGLGAETLLVLGPLLAGGHYDRAHYAAALAMLGELAIAEGRFARATPYLEQALALEPGLDAARMMLGMNRLRLGAFALAWPDYATREAIPELYPDGPPLLADQVWQGQDLRGHSLLVTDDQGHGDAVQFFRYLPLLRDRGPARITWRTFPPLVRLLGDAAPYATVLNGLPDDARFDFHCHSTNLPRWFGTELDTIPTPVAYLWPPVHLKSGIRLPAIPPGMASGPKAERSGAAGSSATRSKAAGSSAQRSKEAGSGAERSTKAAGSGGGRSKLSRLNVGLVWSGDARHTRDHLRSIPAGQFLRLTDVPGIDFHSLQHEVRPADLVALNARPAVGREVEKAVDFADTAALIDRLDLVITVDTGISHLAGALGKPVWVVLHVAPDWRWLVDRTDSPWYPSVRLFRVTRAEWLGERPTLAERLETGLLSAERFAQGETPALEPMLAAGFARSQSAAAPHDAAWGPVLDRVAAALRAFAAG